jgi:hypothetical protein
VTLVENVAWCLAAAGIVLAVASLAVFREPLPSLRLMLDLFTAAGLLRLTVDATWSALAGVALVIAIRRLLTRTLTADLAAAAGRRGRVRT